MKFKILIVLSLLFFFGCNKNAPVVPVDERLNQDIATIDQFLKDNGITAVEDTTGIRYVIHNLGTGVTPKINNCVRVSYKGSLLQNYQGSQTPAESLFDSNTNYKSPLGFQIGGWQIAFQHFPAGTTATIFIPSYYGYGTQPKKNASGETVIPANSNLVFDIELFDVYAYNTGGGYCYTNPLLLPEVQLQQDIAAIDQYLSANNISAQIDPSGIRYIIQNSGDGIKPTTAANCVKIKYTGKLLSGEIFDTNEGFKAPLKRLIQGLQTSLALFPKGTKATVYIPSIMAYGPTGSGARIPPNANLIFEVELLDVTEYNATLDYCN